MNKTIIILIFILIFGCKENPQQVIPPKECPLPVQLTDPNAMPLDVHYAIKLSPDGTKMFFSPGLIGVKILDLKTLNVTQFDIRPLLPSNTKLGAIIPVMFWCPYDNNKFVTLARLGIDTVGDGKKYHGRDHLLKLSIDNSYYEDITPKILGPIGAEFSLALRGWLPASTNGNDFFLIGYALKLNGKDYYAKYNPYTQEIIEIDYDGLKTYTYDWNYKYYVNFDSSHKLRYYLNNNELIFKDIEYANTSHASFSPDGRLFAIAADVKDNSKNKDSCRLSEVWLIDVEKFMQNPVQPVPVKIINIKEKFCMFSYGLHPVFTSNNTLAVSMFKAGDTFSYLHEIDINGNYIRQLTFVP